MTILEATARPFNSEFRGGGERYPTVLAQALAATEDVVFSYCGEGVRTPPEGIAIWTLPGVSFRLPPFAGPLNPVPTPSTLLAMRSFLLDHSHDLEFVHIHNLRTAFSASWLSMARVFRSSGRFRVLLTDHNARSMPFPRELAKLADGYVAVSESSLATLQTLATRPGVVIPPAVPESLMRQAVMRPLDDRPIDLLFLGRLVPWKRPDLLIPLAESLEKRLGRPVRTVVAGAVASPAYLETLRDLVRHASLTVPPRLMENPSDTEIGQLYGSARLLVALSMCTDMFGRRYRNPELAPATPVEAAAFGTPSVVSDLPGVREQVRPGVTGLVVDPSRSSDVVDAIAGLLEDEQRWVACSRASRAFVEQERTVAAQVDRFRAYLGELRRGAL